MHNSVRVTRIPKSSVHKMIGLSFCIIEQMITKAFDRMENYFC